MLSGRILRVHLCEWRHKRWRHRLTGYDERHLNAGRAAGSDVLAGRDHVTARVDEWFADNRRRVNLHLLAVCQNFGPDDGVEKHVEVGPRHVTLEP